MSAKELQDKLKNLTDSYFAISDEYKKSSDISRKEQLVANIREVAKKHEELRDEIAQKHGMFTLPMSIEIDIRRNS